jgi:putative heme-binding domain-containing protein
MARQPALAIEIEWRTSACSGWELQHREGSVWLLEGTEPTPVQLAAIETRRQFAEPEVAQTLIARWRSLGPGVRTPAIQLLLQRRQFHEFLLAAIESDKIKLGELNLDLEQRRELLRDSSPEIRRAPPSCLAMKNTAIAKPWSPNGWRNCPRTATRSEAGSCLRKDLCAVSRGERPWQSVGPDLTDASHRSVEDLASNILDPNMAINPNYVSYFVETDSGELETGILQSESAEAITLLQALGKKVVIPRRKIKRLEASGLSLMPEGLEAVMTPAELRDLIAFLQEKR